MEVDSWTQERGAERKTVMARRIHWGTLAIANEHSGDKGHFALFVLAIGSNTHIEAPTAIAIS